MWQDWDWQAREGVEERILKRKVAGRKPSARLAQAVCANRVRRKRPGGVENGTSSFGHLGRLVEWKWKLRGRPVVSSPLCAVRGFKRHLYKETTERRMQNSKRAENEEKVRERERRVRSQRHIDKETHKLSVTIGATGQQSVPHVVRASHCWPLKLTKGYYWHRVGRMFDDLESGPQLQICW